MSGAGLPRAPGQRVELRIGVLHIAGSSGIAARRLADALPAAIEAAIAGVPVAGRPDAAQRVAGDVVAAVARARETAR